MRRPSPPPPPLPPPLAPSPRRRHVGNLNQQQTLLAWLQGAAPARSAACKVAKGWYSSTPGFRTWSPTALLIWPIDA